MLVTYIRMRYHQDGQQQPEQSGRLHTHLGQCIEGALWTSLREQQESAHGGLGGEFHSGAHGRHVLGDDFHSARGVVLLSTYRSNECALDRSASAHSIQAHFKCKWTIEGQVQFLWLAFTPWNNTFVCVICAQRFGYLEDWSRFAS